MPANYYPFFLVDGKWATWSEYGTCSETCGVGDKIRSRKCNNPPPAHGGENCIGEDKQTLECTLKECPGNNSMFGLSTQAKSLFFVSNFSTSLCLFLG